MSITNYAAKKLIDYDSENSFAFRLRKKRAERIEQLIDNTFTLHKKVNILDVGGTRLYWKLFSKKYLHDKNVHITILNLPSSETLPKDDVLFSFVHGDGCNMQQFADNSYHIVHSNSVIEHVGSWENMQQFAAEIQRVAEAYYIQTPNFWFPVEPHFMTPFFHWFPKTFRANLLMRFKLGWYPRANSFEGAKGMVESCDLLTKKDLRELFPEATIYAEKFGFLIKSFVLIGRK